MGIYGDLFDFDLSDIACKGLLDIFDTIRYIIRTSLGDHFNRSIPKIANLARKVIVIGYVERSKSKTHALHPAGENYVLRCRIHSASHGTLKAFSMQGGDRSIN